LNNRITRQVGQLNRNEFWVGLAFLCFVGLISAVFIILPAYWTIVLVIGVSFLCIWLISLLSGHDFEFLFLIIFTIGLFQGLASKLTVNYLPQSVWGISKYGLMILIVFGYILRVGQGKPLVINRAMLIWMVFWGFNWIYIVILMVDASQQSPYYSPLATIQQFGLGNMLLAVIFFLVVRPNQVEWWLKLLIWAGILSALFGIIQRLLGPERLSNFGLSYDTLLASMAFLSANNPETNFLDLTHGFRAFSFFDTHHAFSAFLILSTIALQIRWLQGHVRKGRYLLIMAILWAGFAVTFNLTNMLTCMLALLILSVLKRGERVSSFIRALSSRHLWRTAIKVSFLSLFLIIAIAPLRNRFIGIFNVYKGASGAGGSLAYRLEGFTSGLRAMIDYPFGFGLYLNSTGDLATRPDLNRYARVNNYFEERNIFFSGDNWFQWLMVQIGLPGFLIFAGMFLIPIAWGLKWRYRIKHPGLSTTLYGSLALIIAVFIAGVSNSPVLTFPPSNLLFWSMVGILLKIPSWDNEKERLVSAYRC